MIAPTAAGTPSAGGSSNAPSISPDLWAVAFNKLKPEDQAKLNFGQPNRRQLLEDLGNILNQKQELCLQRRWKFVNRKGETVIVRDVFEKIANSVKKFVEVVDVAIQYDPTHAALPWAGVRFLLQLVVNASDVNASVSESLEKVSRLVTRYAIVELVYLSKSLDFRELLESHITKLYLSTLECMVKLSRFVGPSTAGISEAQNNALP
jgi:N-terminal domain of NWD NACHT-NTPase